MLLHREGSHFLPYPHPMSTLDLPVEESAGISSDRSKTKYVSWSARSSMPKEPTMHPLPAARIPHA
jgi:hypothetical protein